MDRLSILLLNFIEKNNSSIVKDEKIVLFGLKIIIATVVEIFIIFIIGIWAKHTRETIVYLCIFGFLKSNAGGYHARSLNKCLLLTTSTYIFTLVLAKLHIWKYKKIFFVIFVMVMDLVLSIAPVETAQNKMPKRNVQLRKRRIVCFIFAIEILCVFLTYSKVVYFILMAAIWSGLTVVAGKLYNLKGW